MTVEENAPAGRYGFKVETSAGAVWDLRAELSEDRDTWAQTLRFVAQGMYQQADWLQFDAVYDEMRLRGELPWHAAPETGDESDEAPANSGFDE